MRHLFILNPAAGKGKTLKLVPAIKSYFAALNEDYKIEITKYPGHATEIAAQYSSQQPCRIYSVGGDGTLNEVLNGMAGSNSSLGVIPSGSGNDFIKSIDPDSPLNNIIARSVEGSAKLIDIARVNGRYFINIASLGFDAQVAHTTQHFKKLPLITGKMAYILGIFTTILQRKTNMLEIGIDGGFIEADALLIAIGNGRYYGGGMMPVPEAEITDGMFDICLVDNISRMKILRLFPLYMKGQHGKISDVHFYKGKRVEIKSASPIAMNSDGEISIVNEAIFEILPKALSFIFPK
ncbi:MAG: diacylglycerol kinase family lipid kinase [Ruminiclostridium sp.]|nr:diacylglycerol kinase family lipid kinase [Ruminiclostridium sp.]